MVKDDLYTTVPSFFRCPISLDVMRSPVSLCTGVTYDRASIQRWLDSGNNTCPATMQVLHNKDLIPNRTLERLIKIWSDTVKTRRPNSADSVVNREQARQLAQQIATPNVDIDQHDNDDDKFCKKICRLNLFAKQSDENCEFLLSVEEQLLSFLFSILGNGKHAKNVDLAYKTAQLTVMLLQHVKKHKNSSAQVFQPIISKIDLGGNVFVSSMVSYMQQKASMELKTEAAKLLELIVSLGFRDSFLVAQNGEIYAELLKLSRIEYDAVAMEASVSCLICLATPRRNRVLLAKANSVEVLTKALSSEKELSVSLTEKLLKLLEMVSSCKEGRAEICGSDARCVEAIVKKVLKVSNAATEHAVTILWSLCCLFRDQRAQQAVSNSNGMAKILLLMQSNCSPAVRQMCSDLLKVFRVCSSMNNYSCLSGYDTKTTHIMPF